jgi:hypothetical protein
MIMTSYRILEQLLALEKRVRQVYVLLSQHPHLPADFRAVWQAMAEDETRHIVALERSAHLFSVMVSPPAISAQELSDVEVAISTAEATAQRPNLNSGEVFRQVLALEGSELNRIDEAWMHSFLPTTSLLLEALTPATQPHIRRLVEAVHRFSTDTTLHAEADALWALYDKPKHETAQTGQTG